MQIMFQLYLQYEESVIDLVVVKDKLLCPTFAIDFSLIIILTFVSCIILLYV
jgi:hypothetical protein